MGRFGAGTPDIDDGSLLFLQHMISKMHPGPDDSENPGDGSKIAVVSTARRSSRAARVVDRPAYAVGSSKTTG